MTRKLVLSIFLLLLHALCDLEAEEVPIITGWSPGVYVLASGLWEEAGDPVKNQRYDHLYSWGEAMVIPNYGVLIELGTANPFVMWDGEPFTIRNVQSRGDGVLEFALKDESTTGSRAFTALRIAFEVDGSAQMDFIRADGSTFGETLYVRLYGPLMK